MKLIFALALSLMFGWTAVAQPVDTAAKANQGTVGVITGMEGGTYAKTGADLTILDDSTLRVLTILGKGSLQNLSDILYLRGVDIGFVQADALTYAKQHNLFPSLTQSIRYIAKLYDEEVHVLARQDINRLEELNGQRVNVDVVGSGSAMTAEILLNAFGIKAKVEHEKQVNGIEALKRGEIAAVIQVGGAPMPLFANLPANLGLHFVPVDLNQTLAETYLPDSLKHDSYPVLIPADAPVATLAVGAVMAVFGWQPGSERYNKVARFIDAFFGKFDQFGQPPRHPKWREVNLAAQVPGWTRFQAAQEWLLQHPPKDSVTAAIKARFNMFLAQSVPEMTANLTGAAKQALFEQFLSWDKQRATTGR